MRKFSVLGFAVALLAFTGSHAFAGGHASAVAQVGSGYCADDVQSVQVQQYAAPVAVQQYVQPVRVVQRVVEVPQYVAPVQVQQYVQPQRVVVQQRQYVQPQRVVVQQQNVGYGSGVRAQAFAGGGYGGSQQVFVQPQRRGFLGLGSGRGKTVTKSFARSRSVTRTR